MERRLGPTGPSNRLWVIRVLLSGVAVFFKREKKKIVAAILYSVFFPDNSEIPTTPWT